MKIIKEIDILKCVGFLANVSYCVMSIEELSNIGIFESSFGHVGTQRKLSHSDMWQFVNSAGMNICGF